MRFQDMDAWSQGMIDGIANYAGDPAVEARCHAATAGIDAAIDDMLPQCARRRRLRPALDIAARRHADGERARQHQARDQRAARTNRATPSPAPSGRCSRIPPNSRALQAGDVRWLAAFEEYARWISPIGMSPRRIAKPHNVNGIDLEPETRVFFMFGSANRDESHFAAADRFDVTRDTAQEHRIRRRPAFLRWRCRLARDDRRSGVAQPLRAAEESAARGRRGALRRLGFSWALEPARCVGRS